MQCHPANAAVGAPECKPALEWLHMMHSSPRPQPAIGLKPLLQVRRANVEYASAFAGGSRKGWCLNLTSAVGPVRATILRSCSARNKVCKVYATRQVKFTPTTFLLQPASAPAYSTKARLTCSSGFSLNHPETRPAAPRADAQRRRRRRPPPPPCEARARATS